MTKLADFLRLQITNRDQHHACALILLKTVLCLTGKPLISIDFLMDHVGVNDMLERLFLTACSMLLRYNNNTLEQLIITACPVHLRCNNNDVTCQCPISVWFQTFICVPKKLSHTKDQVKSTMILINIFNP